MRIPISINTLAKLVSLELRTRIASEDHFTAYDITHSIRRNNPSYNILHEPIRFLVHEHMSSLVYMGRYQACPADFGGKIAILYTPVPSLSIRNLLLVTMN
jgi:hypothetical protein